MIINFLIRCIIFSLGIVTVSYSMQSFETAAFAREYGVDRHAALGRLFDYIRRPDANLEQVRAFVLEHRSPDEEAIPAVDTRGPVETAVSKKLLRDAVSLWIWAREKEAFATERERVLSMTGLRDTAVHELETARVLAATLTEERASAVRDLGIARQERDAAQGQLAALTDERDAARRTLEARDAMIEQLTTACLTRARRP